MYTISLCFLEGEENTATPTAAAAAASENGLQSLCYVVHILAKGEKD